VKQATVYLGLGSNQGDREMYLSQAVRKLGGLPGNSVVGMSGLMETQPLGVVGQGSYLNAAVKIRTDLSLLELYEANRSIERELGRVRTEHWGPRTIDIDLLLYDDRIFRSGVLTIPHPQMHLRSFVLRPMCEIGSDVVHPILGKSMAELAERLGGGDFLPDPARPQLISIAGMIGVGKTTLAEGLCRILSCPVIREAYDTNPYLPEVCGGRKDLALKSQLYFLQTRVRQLSQPNLSAGRVAISDFVFEQDPIFARRTLDPDSLKGYDEHYQRHCGSVQQAAVVVYLKDTPHHCLDRIRKRNRPFEKGITIDMLEWFHRAYEQLFSSWRQSPVIRVDAAECDCRREPNVVALVEQVRHYLAEGTV
jgi:deoxyguanosine kinase